MSVAVQYGRLLRPFPVKRLADGLYHVQADASAIMATLDALQREPPGSPEEWVEALDGLDVLLASLSGRCGDARPLLDQMAQSAHADFQRAVDAMVMVLRGLQLSEGLEAPAELRAA